MHLTQLTLLRSPENSVRMAKLLSSKYAEHQTLWDLRGCAKENSRDFLFRCDVSPLGVEMLVLSASPFTNVDCAWDVKSKAYAPTFTAGQMLAFKLRASPTIARFHAGNRGTQDDLVRTVYSEANGTISLRVAAQAAGERWLATRAVPAGFRVVECEAKRYETYVLQDKRAPIRIPALDLEGVLEIVDPALFTAKQVQGYGRTKFAGMGLMLVRPA